MKATIKVKTEFGTFQRQTARKYMFFVISTGRSAEHIRAEYAREKASSEKALAEYEAVIAAMKAASAEFCRRIDGNSYNEAEMIRKGQAKRGQLFFANAEPQGWEGIGYFSLGQWQEFADESKARIASADERANRAIAKEQEIGYRAIQWSTRYALAAKYADNLRNYGHTNIRIIDITSGQEVK